MADTSSSNVLPVVLIAGAAVGVVILTSQALARRDLPSQPDPPAESPAPPEGATPRELIKRGWSWAESDLHKRGAQQAKWPLLDCVGLITPVGDLRGLEYLKTITRLIPVVGDLFNELTKSTRMNVIVRVDKRDPLGARPNPQHPKALAGFGGDVDGAIKGMYVVIDIWGGVVLIGGG